MGFPELFEKTIGSIHFIPGIYPYGVSLLTPIHFRVPSLIFGPLVAKYLAEKWGFRNVLKKPLAQYISYLAFTLMGWVSWPLYIFVLLASFLAPWWPNIWLKMWFLELFEKSYWFHSKFSWTIPTCVAHDCKIEIFIGYFWMKWVVISVGVYCPHLWAQLVFLWSRSSV